MWIFWNDRLEGLACVELTSEMTGWQPVFDINDYDQQRRRHVGQSNDELFGMGCSSLQNELQALQANVSSHSELPSIQDNPSGLIS